MSRRILVWDLPTRWFHWLLAASFLGAYLIAESERWRSQHALLGYGVMALIGFRLLWGMVGSRYARFAAWPLAPKHALGYLRSWLRRRPEHHVGHNPLGSWAILLMLGLCVTAGVTGWIAHTREVSEWVIELHGTAANATLAVIAMHLIGVITSSLAHRENLVAAMLHGYKRGDVGQAITGARRPVAWLLMAVLVALWQGWIPMPGLQDGTQLVRWPQALDSADAAQ